METYLSTPYAALPDTVKRVVRLLSPECDLAQARALLESDPHVFDTAKQEHVAGIIEARWSQAIEDVGADAGRWRRLAYSAAAMQAQRIPAYARALRALAEAGADPVVLRGLWLAEEVYPDPAQRPHSDVDIVIRPEAIGRAMEALVRLGYSCATPLEKLERADLAQGLQEGWYRNAGVWTARGDAGLDIQLDLHVTLGVVSAAWWPWRPAPEWLYRRTRHFAVQDVELRAFTPGLNFIALCENISRHGLARTARRNLLIRYHDLLLLSQRLGESEWRDVATDAGDLRLGAHVGCVLATLGGLWGCRWPDWLEHTVMPRRPWGDWARYATRRPRWLGLRGRIALFHAAATGSVGDAVRFLARSAGPGLRSFTKEDGG